MLDEPAWHAILVGVFPELGLTEALLAVLALVCRFLGRVSVSTRHGQELPPGLDRVRMLAGDWRSILLIAIVFVDVPRRRGRRMLARHDRLLDRRSVGRRGIGRVQVGFLGVKLDVILHFLDQEDLAAALNGAISVLLIGALGLRHLVALILGDKGRVTLGMMRLQMLDESAVAQGKVQMEGESKITYQ